MVVGVAVFIQHNWDYVGWLFIPPGLSYMGKYLYLSLLRHLSRPIPDDLTAC